MKRSERHYIVQYSGGVCSFWAAKRIIDAFGKDSTTLLFADVKMEDEDLYRFNGDVETYFGVKLTIIADGRTPWEVFKDEKFIGNSRVDMCSRILKRDLLWKYMKQNFSSENAVVVLGMDYTEEHRLRGVQDLRKGWKIIAPMIDEPIWDKCKMVEELKKIDIQPPRLTLLGFPHNNCGGFCIKAGQAHFAHLYRIMPQRYAFHEAKEKEMRSYLGKDVSILKDRRGGTTKPMTLEAFRNRISTGDYDPHEWGGCGCAVD